jgi:hypothetical protein
MTIERMTKECPSGSTYPGFAYAEKAMKFKLAALVMISTPMMSRIMFLFTAKQYSPTMKRITAVAK